MKHYKNVDISNLAEVRGEIAEEIGKSPERYSCRKIIAIVCDNVEFTDERLKEILCKDLYFSYIYFCEMGKVDK